MKKLFLFCVLFFISNGIAFADVLPSDLNNNGVPDRDESEVVLSSNATLLAGEYLFNNLTITNNAVLILKGDQNSTNSFKGVKISANNLTVTKGAFVSADKQGYRYKSGPGTPVGNKAGASYGGVGSWNGVATYGSAEEPLDLGSGSAYKDYGGGAIWLVVSGVLTNDGIISANGGGSSSGGSIYVTTNNLVGSGIFRALGGGFSSSSVYYGLGGGGRIAIYYQISSFTGQVTAAGACGSLGMGYPWECAGDGTVVFKQPDPVVPACTVDCFSNVLFLPGLEASRLYKPDYDGGTENLWEPSGNNSATRNLFMDENGVATREDIYTRDVLDNAYVPIKGNVYKSFLEQLDTMKNSEKLIADYSAIPYDWRLSLDDILNNGSMYSDGRLFYSGINGATSTPYIIQELRRLAKNSRTGKVTVVAHSNGGLVTKALTNKLGAEASELIDKIIFVGVPEVGTPAAVGAILHGFDQSLPIHQLSSFGIKESTAREFAQNLPSAYNLLPSVQYFTYVDDPIITFDNDPLLAEWRGKYGEVIHSAESLRNFIADKERITLPTSDELKSPAIVNSGLLSTAELVHSSLDNWAPPEGILLTEIAGWGEETLKTIVYYQGTKTTCDVPGDIHTCHDTPSLEYSPKMTIDGDGTVVVPSALWTPASTRVQKYWVNLRDQNKWWANGNMPRKHADILEISEVRMLIEDLVTDDIANVLPKYISITTPINDSPETQLHFTLHSPLSLDLYDDLGNHTGVSTTTNSVEENIPGSKYLTFGEVKYISIPKSSSTHLYMNGQSTGSFTLDLAEVDGETTIATTTFSGIPVIEGTTVKMDISQNTGIGGASDLRVDMSGDGLTDISLSPKIGEVITLDTTPPETKITPEGTRGLNGWYTGDVTATVSTTDLESGVSKTSYSIDNGKTWNEYSAPFTVSTEGTTTIQYFSTDKQGNKEIVKNLVVKIDKTAPDARIFIDASTKDLKIEGEDSLGSTTVTKDSNNYIITDEAGHTTKLLFQKIFTGKRLTYAKLTGVKYDSGPTKLVSTSSFLYLWNALVNPSVLLSQTIVVNDTYAIEALYDKKKNQTTVFLKKKGSVVQKQIFPGVHIVKLTVTNGVIGYEL